MEEDGETIYKSFVNEDEDIKTHSKLSHSHITSCISHSSLK